VLCDVCLVCLFVKKSYLSLINEEISKFFERSIFGKRLRKKRLIKELLPVKKSNSKEKMKNDHRFLLLNNGITIGIFILSGENYGRSYGSVDATVLVLSKSGKYLRIHNPGKFRKETASSLRETRLRPRSSCFSDGYDDYLTEYCPKVYLVFLQSMILFRNLYISSASSVSEIYWSNRILEDYSRPFHPQTEKRNKWSTPTISSDWILKNHEKRNNFNNDFSDNHHPNWKVIAYDLKNPQANRLSICLVSSLVKLNYIILIKDEDHYLSDPFPTSSQVSSSHKRNLRLKDRHLDLPGYYEFAYESIIPLSRLNENSLIFEVVSLLFQHYVIERKKESLTIHHRTHQINDEKSNYGREMKELEELSPYLHSLVDSKEDALNKKQESWSNGPEEETFVEGNYGNIDSKYRYPFFPSLPFYITNERSNRFDISYQPLSSRSDDRRGQQKQQHNHLIQWIFSLLLNGIESEEEKFLNHYRHLMDLKNNELWAFPSISSVSPFCSSALNILEPSSHKMQLILLRNDFFHLFHLSSAYSSHSSSSAFFIEKSSFHINLLPHIILNASDNSSNHTSLSLNEMNYHSLVVPFQRLSYFQKYLNDFRERIVSFYHLYSKKYYFSSSSPSSSSSDVASSSTPLSLLETHENYVTEEHYGADYKYSVSLIKRTNQIGEEVYRKLMNIHATYRYDRTILQYDVVNEVTASFTFFLFVSYFLMFFLLFCCRCCFF
jgi:hypothetical protein